MSRDLSSVIKIPQMEIPVSDSCDVIVAGGGIAGVSAALAAARNHADVILLEREYGLGGLATLGLIAIYLPLCDGMGHQVVYGLGEELLKLSISHGAEEGYPYPAAWLENRSQEEKKRERYMVQFNPIFFALELERLLLREGVRILYGTLLADVVMDGNKISGVVVENKSGRSVILANSFVDCTGDSDLCRAAGAKTALFEGKNGLANWYYYQDEKKSVRLSMFGLADVKPGKEEGQADNENDHEDTISDLRFSGVEGKELSEAVIQAHGLMLEDVVKRHRRPVTMSTIPLVRMSRRICGEYTLANQDQHQYMWDSIGMTGDWTKRGPVYEIPFRCLYQKEIPNLLVAGRNISTDDQVWNVTRVIPPCAVTGQAAGTAAAICSDFPHTEISRLQDRLAAQGVHIHEDQEA